MGQIHLMCVGLSFVAGASAVRPVRAGVIFYSQGESIEPLSRLPADSPLREQGASAAGRGGNGPADLRIGYKYYEFSIFWMPVVISDGQYVLYDSEQFLPKKYLPLGTDAEKVAEQAHVTADKIPVPFGCWFPWGWFIYGPLVLFGIFRRK